ncbi:MAG TPA: DUF4349 domain-containing protein, partial [Phaeodactylibacter sp.]|nr:DUF4349 domain-containing protein [Phaeodactylibacter sp.]
MSLSNRFALFAVALLTMACSSSQEYAATTVAQKTLDEASPADSRKIIYNAYLHLTVETPDSTNLRLKAIAKKYGGYTSEIGTYRSVIRVNSEQLNAAVAEVSRLGRVDRKQIRGQDVTEEYLDYQIRLENAQKTRNRYLELLDLAETVDEILKVEKELERLNETIDLLKGKMNRIDQLDAYATITVNLKERKKPGVLGYIG